VINRVFQHFLFVQAQFGLLLFLHGHKVFYPELVVDVIGVLVEGIVVHVIPLLHKVVLDPEELVVPPLLSVRNGVDVWGDLRASEVGTPVHCWISSFRSLALHVLEVVLVFLVHDLVDVLVLLLPLQLVPELFRGVVIKQPIPLFSLHLLLSKTGHLLTFSCPQLGFFVLLSLLPDNVTSLLFAFKRGPCFVGKFSASLCREHALVLMLSPLIVLLFLVNRLHVVLQSLVGYHGVNPFFKYLGS
jgi:hypothetical protein